MLQSSSRSTLRLAAIIACASLLALPAAADPPDAAWRVIETENFRIHFVGSSEEWARRAAARLEESRPALVETIGWAPLQKIDVVVEDPMSTANGMALPLLGTPRMVLWTTPPPPESQIGNYTDWAEIVAIHESAHLIHLLRPSRSPLARFGTSILPVGPLALRVPRWVLEGYATTIEGELTGAGRPHGALRASVIRKWGREGRLPSYGALSSDQSWLGMSMAYLVGSAYLEWLAEREGPGSFRNLWARATARARRSFPAAFEGVYGEAPSVLYGRFAAEQTASAVRREEELEEGLREGELWQDLEWTTGELDLSADESKLVTIVRARQRPPRIVVWSTAPPEEEERKWSERLEKTLARDPEDVAPVRRRPLPRKPLRELTITRGEVFKPRWLPDGQTVAFTRLLPDDRGRLRRDLVLWDSESGSVRRVTRHADVDSADPSHDGSYAVAVRNRDGYSQLVRVDLGSGVVEALTEPSIDHVYSSPAARPGGGSFAFVRSAPSGWQLATIEPSTGSISIVAENPSDILAQPAWSPDGSRLLAVAAGGEHVDIASFDPGGGVPLRVTRTLGAALSPAPGTDGTYFLSLETGGFDIRYIPRADESLTPVELAPRAAPRRFTYDEADFPSRPYGAGRQETMLLTGGVTSSDENLLELGLRVGDLIGRLDTVVAGALTSRGDYRGASLSASWRGLPVDLNAHLFDLEREDELAFANRTGLEASLSLRRFFPGGGWGAEGGVRIEELDAAALLDERRTVLFSELEAGWEPRVGLLRFPAALSAGVERGENGDETWLRPVLRGSAGIGFRSNGLRLYADRRTSDSASSGHNQVIVGGAELTMHPRSSRLSNVYVPALPRGLLSGDEYRGEGAELRLGFVPGALFYERHAAWDDGEGRGPWLRLAGIRGEIRIPPQPLLRFPAAVVTIGAARLVDARENDDSFRYWAAIAWRP
jgi:hypothetical protein